MSFTGCKANCINPLLAYSFPISDRILFWLPGWDKWPGSAGCWVWLWFVSGWSGRDWRWRPLHTRSMPSDWWRWVRGKSDTPRHTTLHCGLPCPPEGATLRIPRHHRSHTPRSGRLVQMEELWRGGWNEKRRRGLKFYRKWWTHTYIYIYGSICWKV